MAEEQNDFQRAQEFMRQQMDEYVPQILEAQRQRAQQPDPVQQQYRQVQDTIRGVVAPELDTANLTAADTRDYVNFYHADNELGRLYQKEVEETFNVLNKNGRPTVRNDILRHALGKMQLDNPEEYKKRQDALERVQRNRAYLAGDIAEGGIGIDRSGGKFKDLDRLSKQSDFSDDDIKQLEDMLAGETF
jgi:hypothetical protein